MAFYDTVWYLNAGDQSTTGYYAVTLRPQNTAVAAGVLRRQFTAPAVSSERVFVCIVAGTTANVTDATWNLTRGAKTTDGTVTWQECTGASAVNGDLTNTPTWAQAKAIGSPTLGAIIKRNNGASYQICSTAGSLGASEPAFSDTAGVTTTDSTTTWTSLGVVGNFTGGQAPFARLERACTSTWFAAGNTIYVGDNHAESQATSVVAAPAISATTVGKIICHNHSGSYPPASGNLMSGASITITAAVNITFTIGGGFYFYGLTVRASGGGNINLSTGGAWLVADNCLFDVANAGGGFTVGSGSYGTTIFNNTTVKFSSTAQKIILTNSQFIWQNTGPVLASGSSIPLAFMGVSTTCSLALEALDLSQLTGILIQTVSIITNLTIKDCKLNASATVDLPTAPGSTLQLIRCDSGATAYKSTRYTYEGTETTETSITRVGGAVDPTGQAQSRKLVTTANSLWQRPFKAEPYAIWNAVTGSNVTVTVCGTVNAGTLPTTDDIWLEVEYLGSSAAPLGTMVTTTKSNLLAANAAVTSDGSTWNGGGSGAGWSPFKLVATLSSPQPGLAGYIEARVRVAKVSATYYIDPKVTLT